MRISHLMYVSLAAYAFLFLIPMVKAEGLEVGKGLFKERLLKKLMEKGRSESTASINEKILNPGDYTYTINQNGYDRPYIVHVPPQYSPQKPMPVVFAFHGGGGTMGYMAGDNYKIKDKADDAGFVVVFPNGYSKFKSGMFATWNAGTCCGDARDKKSDDVGFVRSILQNLNRQMMIDSNKIFATGMSNGGMISYTMACELSDVFTAIASVAGTDNNTHCTAKRPVSILHIHAKDDTHVLFNGGAGEGAFRDESKVTDFVSVPDTIATWVKRNGCTQPAKRVLDVDGAYCDLYSSCRDGSSVKLCVTDTGGHSWPGGAKPRSKEPPSRAISANDEIWSFFQTLR